MPLLTPLGRAMNLPPALDHALLLELGELKPTEKSFRQRPLYQLASCAIDFVETNRDQFIQRLLRFLGSDLTCYRIPHESDLALRQRQDRRFDPLHAWFEGEFGVKLAVSESLACPTHPELVFEGVSRYLQALSPFLLSGLMGAAESTSSLVIALCLQLNHLSWEEAYQLSFMEELYQNEKWGQDEEAVARRHEIQRDLACVELYFKILREC